MNEDLINAVVKQLGYDADDDINNKFNTVLNGDLFATCEDISSHGIGGGFGGFIYYSETVKFFEDNILVRLVFNEFIGAGSHR